METKSEPLDDKVIDNLIERAEDAIRECSTQAKAVSIRAVYLNSILLELKTRRQKENEPVLSKPKFQKGNRVQIEARDSTWHGRIGTVVANPHFRDDVEFFFYRVDFHDGQGRYLNTSFSAEFCLVPAPIWVAEAVWFKIGDRVCVTEPGLCQDDLGTLKGWETVSNGILWSVLLDKYPMPTRFLETDLELDTSEFRKATACISEAMKPTLESADKQADKQLEGHPLKGLWNKPPTPARIAAFNPFDPDAKKTPRADLP